jgi:hypothetical protein
MRTGPTLLIAALALAAGVLGCDSGRTYYAIQYCPKPCDYVCEAGHTHRRYRIPLIEESFTALTEQQDVIMKSGSEISSLTEDQHMTCRVQGQRNWECHGNPTDSPPETYLMDDGHLTYTEANARPGLDRSWIVFTSWCNYKQVEWHVERPITTTSYQKAPRARATAPRARATNSLACWSTRSPGA